ncbi:MAG TPA: N-acetylmuramidase domain-containing protein [Blastocatellia bacterium]|nr:N-acetylmuramidase domain-containing protein [Blastocatellia bacterium]
MPETTPLTGTTTSVANLREGPGQEFKIKIELKAKTKLAVLETGQGQDGKWLSVSVDGLKGFVHGNLVLLPEQKIMSGFLIHQPGVVDLPLAPAVALSVPVNQGSDAVMVARIWNKYGGLIKALATRIGVDPGVAVAVVATESGGSGFSHGRLIIRFENHLFWRFWGKDNADTFNAFFRFNQQQPWKGHEFRSAANQPWQSFHGDQDAEWKVFSKAVLLNEEAGLRSISMGLPQILGDNHSLIGYDSVQEMFSAFQADERIQLIGFFDFIQGPHNVSTRVSALQHKDFVAFASQYNGAGQAAVYGELIRKRFEAFAALN